MTPLEQRQMRRIEQPSPGVKMLMNQGMMTKERMVGICRDEGLDTTGTKMDLAKRIVEHRSKMFSEAWDAIAGKT